MGGLEAGFHIRLCGEGREDSGPCLTDHKALSRLVTPCPRSYFDGLLPEADPSQADVPSSTARAASKVACAKTSLIGNGVEKLKEVCEGASPRSLAGPRDDSYAKVRPRRICDSSGERGQDPGPRFTLRSSRGGPSAYLPPRLSGLSARRIRHRRMVHLRQGERPQVWPLRRLHGDGEGDWEP